MNLLVKEDAMNCTRRTVAPRFVLVALALCAGAVPAVGQAPDQAQPANSLVASVRDWSQERQRVQVALNRTVLVETTVQISQVNVIADEIADVQAISPSQLLITGQGYGNTNILLVSSDGQQHLLEVSVELDLESLNEALLDVDPQAQVEARSVMGHVLLTGTVSGPEKAERMLQLAELFIPPGASGDATVQNHLRVVGEQQVMLHCVVAEVNRTASKQLGINGFLAGSGVEDMFVINQLGGINPINIGAAANAPADALIPFLTGEDGIPNSPSNTLSLGFPKAQMQLFLRALSDDGLLRVLAEPNLVAISGETASFLAGGEFPVPVPQGDFRVTIEYRQYGVRLNFTPMVLDHQRIRMRVAPEVSDLDYANATQLEGFLIPSLTSRSAETTIELGNGETIAIAGLLNDQVRGLASSVPGLGDIPVLGALFRSVEYRRSISELVILVTPHVVSPMRPDQVPSLPGHDWQPPDNFQLYALGWLEDPRVDGAPEAGRPDSVRKDADAKLRSEPDNPSVHGPWGYSSERDMQ
jgi:pilus assembly protein CpaC